MPISKATPSRLVKLGESYAVIPSSTIAMIPDATALAILIYLLDKPADWQVRKKDVCKALNIGSDRWTKATKLLADLDLYMVTAIKDENGRFVDQSVAVSAVPMGLLPECGKPDSGKTEIRKPAPIHITEDTHDIDTTTTTKQTRMKRPSVEEVRQYVQEKGYTFDPDHFFNYNEAAGWMLGRNKPMKNWKAACATWQRNEDKRNEKTQRGNGYARPDMGKRKETAADRLRDKLARDIADGRAV